MQNKTWKSLNNAVSGGSILELNNTLSLRSPQSGKYVNTLEETTVANAKIHKKLPQTRSEQLIRASLFKSSTGVELLSSEEKDMDIGNKFSKDLNIFLPWFSSKHEDK